MNNEYILLDSGNLKKLEQVGPYRIIRPALNAFWKPALPEREWKDALSEFVRDSSGNGRWRNREAIPDTWNCLLGKMNIKIKPTGFGPLSIHRVSSSAIFVRHKAARTVASVVANRMYCRRIAP